VAVAGFDEDAVTLALEALDAVLSATGKGQVCCVNIARRR